jgi:hypothetical protein
LIYICIPTHNEQQTVGVVLWKVRQVLTDFPRDYQLLVADDASTDKTAEVLEPYTRVLPLTVDRSDKRQGSAASLEMLLREAVRRSEYPKRDVIVTLQADFSEEPDDLVPLVKRLEAGADVAVGNKVSASKETRTRRFARSLAGFFMRRQKWPEGVATPFEGYRAYRLHAIKRAVEARAGSRLICHDGWAGHAELLKAVLPHARRVDVVDVDERPDRLQRARREKPFAAAMQVRLMASGAEPPGLTGVEELDRIARTASRSRDRSTVTTQSIQAQGTAAGARTNGSRTRPGTGARREEGRSRSQGNGRTRGESPRSQGESPRSRGESPRSRGESGPSSARRERAQPAEKTERPGQKSGDQGSGRTRGGQGRQRKPRPDAVTGVVDAAAIVEGAPAPTEPNAPNDAVDTAPIEAGAEGAAAEATARPKRKRRRRKRSGQGNAANVASLTNEDGTTADPSETATSRRQHQDSPEGARRPDHGPALDITAGVADESTAEAADDGSTGASGTKKRRRRGGRRGGKGRRKPRTDAAAGGDNGGTGQASSETQGEPAAGEAPMERPAPIDRPAVTGRPTVAESPSQTPAERPAAETVSRDND